MKIYDLKEDVPVFGRQVKTFPVGIGEAFEKLANSLPGGFERSYYGISYLNKEGIIIYNAAAEEKYEGEAGKYHLDWYVIENGKYLMVPIKDWRKKTDSIKGVFHEMMKDSRVSNNCNCVEWYKSEDEMLCMIKIEP